MDSQKQTALDAAREVMLHLHLQHKQRDMEPLEPLILLSPGTIEYKGAVLHGVLPEHDELALVRAVDTYLAGGTAVLPAGVTLELPGGAQ